MINDKNILAVILLSFFLVSCGPSGPANFKILEGTSNNSNRYAKTVKYAGIMNQEMFDYFIRIGRNSIVSDKDLKESNKKELLNELDSLQFIENHYLYFTMVYNMPFLDDELNLKFELLNKNKQNYVIGDTLIYQKLYRYGALESVNYSYVVYCKQSIEQAIKDGATKFVVKFPDGASNTYSLKL